jgi:hypothetical protein
VPPRYVAIANPDGKRWQLYARELAAFWAARGVTPEVEVVPWREVVPRGGNLDGLAAFDRPALVRLESPGRDFEVTKLFLQAGQHDTPGEDGIDYAALPYQKGRLVRPGLLYRGFRRVLIGLHHSFEARPHLTPLSCPLAVAEMFDKNATLIRLEKAGVPVPPYLAEQDIPTAPGALRHGLHVNERWQTAYVKLNTGSSASAIVVLAPRTLGGMGLGSLVGIGEDFYSTRRLRHYEEWDELDAVLGFLLREGACVQCGIPMARIDGQNFDVRVVMSHNVPTFAVFRLSSLPMTNLHLGGRRGDPASCRAAIPTRAWLDAMDHCYEVSLLYPCATIGIDLLFENGFFRHYVLEVNAFGDFFPGLTDEQGRTVHGREIEDTARRWGLLS